MHLVTTFANPKVLPGKYLTVTRLYMEGMTSEILVRMFRPLVAASRFEYLRTDYWFFKRFEVSEFLVQFFSQCEAIEIWREPQT